MADFLLLAPTHKYTSRVEAKTPLALDISSVQECLRSHFHKLAWSELFFWRSVLPFQKNTPKQPRKFSSKSHKAKKTVYISSDAAQIDATL